jgi:hypothetical protein
VVGGAVRAAGRPADLHHQRLHARTVVGHTDDEALGLRREREVGRLPAFQGDVAGGHPRVGGRERRQQPLSVVRVQQPSQVRHTVALECGRANTTTPGRDSDAPMNRSITSRVAAASVLATLVRRQPDTQHDENPHAIQNGGTIMVPDRKAVPLDRY